MTHFLFHCDELGQRHVRINSKYHGFLEIVEDGYPLVATTLMGWTEIGGNPRFGVHPRNRRHILVRVACGTIAMADHLLKHVPSGALDSISFRDFGNLREL